MEKGNQEISVENYGSAIKLYNKLLRDDPNYKDALYNRAVCYMHLNQHKLAVPDLLTVEKDDPYYDRQLYIALTM
jgi:lipoprotein NlpI